MTFSFDLWVNMELLPLFLIILLAYEAKGLRCYSCTLAISEGDTDVDMACVNDPANAVGKPQLTCPARMKYCTIVRNDFKDTGALSSIYRNCAENPDIMNEDIEGPDMMYHYRTCTTDLCNKGTGLENPNLGGEGGGGLGGIVIDGSGSSGVTSSFVLFTISLLISLLYLVD